MDPVERRRRRLQRMRGRPCPKCSSSDTWKTNPNVRDAIPMRCDACGHAWKHDLRGWSRQKDPEEDSGVG